MANKEAIAYLCDVIDNGDSSESNFVKLVSSIKNTMSELKSVNPFYNSQLR